MKTIRRLIFTVISLAVIAVVSFAIIFKNIDKKSFVEDQLTSNSGFNTHFEGAFSLSLFPKPQLFAEKVIVDAFEGEKPLFLAENITLETTLIDFFTGSVAIENLVADNMAVYLNRSIKNVPNWEAKRKKRRAKSKSLDLSFLRALGQMSFKEVTFVYEDDYTGQQFILEEGVLKVDGYNPEKTEILFYGIFNEQELSFGGELNIPEMLLKSLLTVAENHIRLNGNIAAGFDGFVNVDGPSLLTRTYDILNIAPSERQAHFPINLDGGLVINRQTIELKEAKLSSTYDGYDLLANVNAFVSENEKQVDLIFTDTLDLNQLGLCTKKNKNTSHFSWSQEKLDLNPLKNFIGVATARLSQGIKCHGLSLDFLDIELATDGDTLSLKKGTIKKADGFINMTGSLGLNRPHRSHIKGEFETVPYP